MDMNQIQRKLIKIVGDLDAVALEMWARGMGEDWNRLEDAITNVGQVCAGFLDEKDWKRLPVISECVRPSSDEVLATRTS